MQTIQEQPGRCLGCLVVAATDEVPGSLLLSPKAAAEARALRPEDSYSRAILLAITILLFVASM